MNKEKLRESLKKDYLFKKELLEETKNLRSKVFLPYDVDIYAKYSKEIHLREGELAYNSNILSKLDAGEFD